MEDQHWSELERAAAPPHLPSPPTGTGLSLWLSPEGRISRSTYWLKFALPIWGIQMAALVADASLGLLFADSFGVIYVLVSVALLWPGVIAMVKRLHDLGHSGWLVPGIYGSGMLAGIATAVAVGIGGVFAALAGIALVGFALAALWITIKIAFFRGTVGANEFGPDPLRS